MTKTTANLDWLYATCEAPNQTSRAAAEVRQSQLTKPPGSLGLAERLAVDFAGYQGTPLPELNRVQIRVYAGDHGVCVHGVSAFPQEVTAQMVLNFASGGAAISVLAKQFGANFKVVNLGTTHPTPSSELVRNVTIDTSTSDMTSAPAMSENQLARALEVGREEVIHSRLFIGGEMGIGNTTSASAMYCALLNLSSNECVGPGTGLEPQGVKHKAQIVQRAMDKHLEQAVSPIEVLRHFGGFEIAALVGSYVHAAQRGIPSLVDGFICTAAALCACQINPSVRPWLQFAHRSAEPAHHLALRSLNVEPILDLKMRLGEGSGAAMAVPIIQNAILLHNNMATFSDAGVTNKDD